MALTDSQCTARTSLHVKWNFSDAGGWMRVIMSPAIHVREWKSNTVLLHQTSPPQSLNMLEWLGYTSQLVGQESMSYFSWTMSQPWELFSTLTILAERHERHLAYYKPAQHSLVGLQPNTQKKTYTQCISNSMAFITAWLNNWQTYRCVKTRDERCQFASCWRLTALHDIRTHVQWHKYSTILHNTLHKCEVQMTHPYLVTYSITALRQNVTDSEQKVVEPRVWCQTLAWQNAAVGGRERVVWQPWRCDAS